MKETKTCNQCNKDKPSTEFYTQKKIGRDKVEWIYYNPKCKECVSESTQQWQNENPEWYARLRKEKRDRIRETPKEKERTRKNAERQRKNGYQKEYQQKNPAKMKVYNERHKHKEHKINKKEWNACKNYFNNECAYCGITYDEHKKVYKQDLHKDHVIHEGRNDLKNCVPSCKNCNSQKWQFPLNKWYNRNNINYTYERYLKIYQWLRYDCRKHMQKKKPRKKHTNKNK